MSFTTKRLAVECGVCGVLLSLVVACGGSEPEPGVPPPAPEGPEEAPDRSWDTGGPTQTSAEPDASEDEHKSEPEADERKAPEFTDGMSVNDAIAAVPSHYEYIGMEQEVLAKPLMNTDTYKGCNVNQSTHFSVRIAVWNGKVVGADVSAKGNKKLAACIDSAVRKIEYKEKVESINTVEYSM
jgi:hypothetical protein